MDGDNGVLETHREALIYRPILPLATEQSWKPAIWALKYIFEANVAVRSNYC